MISDGDIVDLMTSSGEVVTLRVVADVNVLWRDNPVGARLVHVDDDDNDAYCKTCGERLNGEIAEIVRNDVHYLVHVGCMVDGEELA